MTFTMQILVALSILLSVNFMSVTAADSCSVTLRARRYDDIVIEREIDSFIGLSSDLSTDLIELAPANRRRGFSVVVFDRTTLARTQSATFDCWAGSPNLQSTEFNAYLTALDGNTDVIVAIVNYDTSDASGGGFALIQSWGCAMAGAEIPYRSAFAFIGVPTNIPSEQASFQQCFDDTSASIEVTVDTGIYCTVREYDIGDKTYQEMVDACAANIQNGRLAYESEILAYLGGPIGGQVWTPVADEYNEWLQIGGGTDGSTGWDYGVLHSDADSGNYGLPDWGTDEERLSNWDPKFWQKFYCEVDVSGCSTLLTVAQSLTEYDIGDKTYQECADACAANSQNGRLASESEILAYLPGPLGGDVWTPVADKYNEWLQIGGSNPWDYGVLHSDIGPGTEGGVPSWGTDEERSGTIDYWRNFYCAGDVPESTILAAGLCSEIKANSGGISAVDAKVDKRIENVNGRINDVNTAVEKNSARIEAVNTALGTRIDTANTADTALGKRIDNADTALGTLGTKVDTADTALGTRIDTLGTKVDTADTALGKKIDNAVAALGTLGTRVDTADTALGKKIDKLVASIQGVSASAKSFGGVSDVIGGAESVSDSWLSFSRTELLLLCLNAVIIVINIGLCICWKGGLFSNGQRGYSKVSPYYETEVENTPINA